MIATSGRLMIGVLVKPPSRTRLVIVIVELVSSAGKALPAGAATASRAISAAARSSGFRLAGRAQLPQRLEQRHHRAEIAGIAAGHVSVPLNAVLSAAAR
jgi:hypothetical protein